MKCSNCHNEWKTEPKMPEPDICPFCGFWLNQKKQTNRKEPFYFTWGLIHEEKLRKSLHNPEEADYQQALDNFSIAFAEQKNLGDRIADLMVDYPQYAANNLKYFPDSSQDDRLSVLKGNLSEDQFPIAALYLEALEAGSPTAGIKLMNFLKSRLDDQKVIDILISLIYSDLSWMEHSENYLALSAGMALLQKNYSLAVLEMKNLLNANESRLMILNDSLFNSLMGLPTDLAARIEMVGAFVDKGSDQQLSRDDLNQLIQLLCRPLEEDENKFAVLESVDEKVIHLLEDHKEEAASILEEMITSEVALSGTHLLMQQLSNASKDLKTQLEPVLKKHYEKVYMKPYSWIAETDYTIDPRFSMNGSSIK
ncbi:hypothetical protein [Ileibacterium valens]|uniref:hypothetical protein n=1 Tax=Ileibacterium valens TaxID=1862668 RepID=UPI00272D141D|nr:hypothetical protein [Ileibacterium valens]